ncbi:MAG: hypothetical protein M5R41_05775 [Bacteroidia bacterium]|nr:hypothetical protein [Bacteroidia bacterium]
MQNIIGRDTELLDFMREHGFPVFHLSNIFYRDFQYGVRDYFRAKEGVDVGTRKADDIARQVIADLEQRSILRPHSRNTWILHHERYLRPRVVKEAAASKEAAA